MKLIRDLNLLTDATRGGAVTIGNFDGVHRGHAVIIQHLLKQARRVKGPATVFTFDPHPVRILRPTQAPPPLTWTDRKAELLCELGVDLVIAYPTDRALLALSARDFFQRIVGEALHATAVVEGPNFHFGHGREGDVEKLGEFCREQNIQLEIVSAETEAGEYISSSRVRECVARGDVATARQFLTQPYRIRGIVSRGAQRGTQIGVPTANLEEVHTLLPIPAVYAGRGYVKGIAYPAAINIGSNPTFAETTLKIEAHLVGFEGSLYDQPLEIDFLEKLRDIRAFVSVDELKIQLASDIQATRRIFQRHLEGQHLNGH